MQMSKQTISFDYFHGCESEQFTFYRIPKVLFTNDYFKGLSSDAKVLYGLMLDRMALSVKIIGLTIRTEYILSSHWSR